MKALITGGAGFIGSHIVDLAIRDKHQVVIVDDLSNGSVDNLPPAVDAFELAKFYQLSILDPEFLEVVKEEQPRVIFHEAAQPSLRRSIDDPVFDATVNVVGTLNVLKAAQLVGAHLVFASTSAVYAPNAPTPFYEPDSGRPNLPYGIAKFAAELYIKHSGLTYTILRYGNVYGPRQCPVGENQLIPHCIRYLRGEEPGFRIHGDGEQMRDWIYVTDIARANLQVGGLKMEGVFNCGTGVGVSVNVVCGMLAKIAGKEMDFPHGPAKAGEARHSILAVGDILRTGWQPRVRLYDGLQRTWESYATHG